MFFTKQAATARLLFWQPPLICAAVLNLFARERGHQFGGSFCPPFVWHAKQCGSGIAPAVFAIEDTGGAALRDGDGDHPYQECYGTWRAAAKRKRAYRPVGAEGAAGVLRCGGRHRARALAVVAVRLEGARVCGHRQGDEAGRGQRREGARDRHIVCRSGCGACGPGLRRELVEPPAG
eukprot:SAG31_NODE_1158_length_9605_cov_2.788555_1_plen_178_part_00